MRLNNFPAAWRRRCSFPSGEQCCCLNPSSHPSSTKSVMYQRSPSAPATKHISLCARSSQITEIVYDFSWLNKWQGLLIMAAALQRQRASSLHRNELPQVSSPRSVRTCGVTFVLTSPQSASFSIWPRLRHGDSCAFATS